MKKEEFVKVFAEESNLSIKEATSTFEALTSSLLKIFEQGEGLTLQGFGKFEIKERAAHIGHNPSTGEEVEVPAKKNVTFKAGKLVKEAVNK